MSWLADLKHKWWGPSHIIVPSAEGRRKQVIASAADIQRFSNAARAYAKKHLPPSN